MATATVGLAVVLALAFLAAGIPKATAAARSTAQADHLGVPRGLYRLIGALEVLGAVGVIVGLWLPWLGVAAGVGLTLLMVGAIASHLRAKDTARELAPALLIAALSVAHLAVRTLTI